jgi:hypothetical protein
VIARLAKIVDRMLWHAYAIAAVVIAYEYVTDELDFNLASFQVASAQARALILIAGKLVGT